MESKRERRKREIAIFCDYQRKRITFYCTIYSGVALERIPGNHVNVFAITVHTTKFMNTVELLFKGHSGTRHFAP